MRLKKYWSAKGYGKLKMTDSNIVKGETKCGFVTVLGSPNAGKATLVNALVGAKVSIVTPKVQTTRARIRGVAVHGDTQIVYIDTPGIFTPRRKLDRSMVAAAWEGTEDSDICVLIIDAHAWAVAGAGAGEKLAAARKAVTDSQAIIDGLKAQGQRAVLVLNKIDKLKRDQLLHIAQELNETGIFTDTFMISAEKGFGLDGLRDHFLTHMKTGPWMYPADQLSDMTDRLMAAEITREKLFLRLHQEIPYALTVETEKYEWLKNKKNELRIEQVIYVQREGQKKLVLGRGGQTIKIVGQAAREELSEILGCKVHLFLFVKIRENWQNDPARYREMGLEISQ